MSPRLYQLTNEAACAYADIVILRVARQKWYSSLTASFSNLAFLFNNVISAYIELIDLCPQSTHHEFWMERDHFLFSRKYAAYASCNKWRSQPYAYMQAYDNRKSGVYAYIADTNEQWYDSSYVCYFAAQRSQLRRLKRPSGRLPRGQ